MSDCFWLTRLVSSVSTLQLYGNWRLACGVPEHTALQNPADGKYIVLCTKVQATARHATAVLELGPWAPFVQSRSTLQESRAQARQQRSKAQLPTADPGG